MRHDEWMNVGSRCQLAQINTIYHYTNHRLVHYSGYISKKNIEEASYIPSVDVEVSSLEVGVR